MFGDRLLNISQTSTANTSSKNLKPENRKDEAISNLPASCAEGLTNETKSITNEVNTSETTKTENVGNNSKEKKTKKKSSWFNSFYPTYKSRSADFKRIFKEVPDDERLLVDYSCAVQKEILVHGRLYSTQNFLCFYANIFGWETNIVTKWKDVTSITKEKTAIVIPNAILISTKSEKYFFTSFVARDKSYLMLFRVWQNALMDRQMSNQEMWKWVHQSYGAELGLTSDDEDYVAPGTEEGKLSMKETPEIRLESENLDDSGLNSDTKPQEKDKNDSSNPSSTNLEKNNFDVHGSTDVSDTDFSDLDLPAKCNSQNVNCSCSHEGRQLVNDIVSIHVDQLFTLLFTSSKFYLDFHASRKTTNIVQTPWTENALDKSKTRVVNLTVALSQPIGPKFSHVTETQIMLPCSKAGVLYSINAESVSGGVPYGDSFYIDVHFCIKKVSENQSSLAVYAQIKFKKSVWGLVKGMIEKNCWSGLEDFFSSLSKALQSESEGYAPEVKKKSKRRMKLKEPSVIIAPLTQTVPSVIPKKTSGTVLISPKVSFIIFMVLILFFILNIILYYKLRSLEEEQLPNNVINLNMLRNPPATYDEWIKLLKKQDQLHKHELKHWNELLKTAMNSLKKTKEVLVELQESINSRIVKNILQDESIIINNATPSPEL